MSSAMVCIDSHRPNFSCAARGRPVNANLVCAYKRHCWSVVNNECYIADVNRILCHVPPPTDTGGVQVDDIEWHDQYEKYDTVTFAEAYEEAKVTVTAGVANACPPDRDILLMPPHKTGHQTNTVQAEASDSDDGFNMEGDLY